MTFFKIALRATLLAAIVPTHAAEAPMSWDLTFSTIKPDIPPAAPEDKRCPSRLQEIGLQAGEIQSAIAGVPLEKLDEAVLVHDSWHRYGVFVGAGRAYAMTHADKRLTIHEIGVAEAQEVIRQYAGHEKPSKPGLLSDIALNECRSQPSAAVSILHDGKSRQYWLSGWDFAERMNKWRGADLLGILLLGGNGSGDYEEPRWAEKLSAAIDRMSRDDNR